MRGKIEERQCLECSNKLHGRADQKFCSDQCRNSYNNRNNNANTVLMREINAALRKNRKILLELCSGEKAKTNREKLLKSGFDFSYFTHVYQTRTGSTYHFVYEMGYLNLENDELLIVRRGE